MEEAQIISLLRSTQQSTHQYDLGAKTKLDVMRKKTQQENWSNGKPTLAGRKMRTRILKTKSQVLVKKITSTFSLGYIF